MLWLTTCSRMPAESARAGASGPWLINQVRSSSDHSPRRLLRPHRPSRLCGSGVSGIAFAHKKRPCGCGRPLIRDQGASRVQKRIAVSGIWWWPTLNFSKSGSRVFRMRKMNHRILEDSAQRVVDGVWSGGFFCRIGFYFCGGRRNR